MAKSSTSFNSFCMYSVIRLTGEWEHSVSKLEWCKENIPGFIENLKKARGSDGENILHEIVGADVKPDSELFIGIAREVPELLEIKDNQYRSVAWSALQNVGVKFFKMVFSLQNDCTILDGIGFDDEPEASYEEDPADFICSSSDLI